MSDNLAARAAKYRWFHSIDLGGGVVTAGTKSVEILRGESAAIFDRVDLRGRSVLDVGAWNGYFSFEAERRGAARILATDSHLWIDEDIRGREAFDLAREALKSGVEPRQIDVADLSVETVGQFDIVLFLGVFYHLHDSIEVLGRVAALARELLIVETYLDLRDLKVPAMRYYPGVELANSPSNWWGPNEQLVQSLLRHYGFVEIESTVHPATDRRGIFHAWRSTAGRLQALPDAQRLKPWEPPRPPPPPKLTVPQKIVREICRPFRRQRSSG